MNTTSPFSTQPRPELSLKRREGSTAPVPMPYDNTLPFERGGATSDPYGPSALQAAWDKLYRARSLLEAEQAHMRDDRIAIQGELDALELREQAVAARELRVQQIELHMRLDQQDAEDARESRSTIAKISSAPFELARSVFGTKK
jgi:hypothetical protein